MCACVFLRYIANINNLHCSSSLFLIASCLSCLNNTNNDSEQSESATENLNNKDLDEGWGGLSIWQGATSSSNSDAHTTEQVGKTYWETGTKDSESCPQVLNSYINIIKDKYRILDTILWIILSKVVSLCQKNNSNNNSIDSHGFTENNTIE